MSNLIVIAKIEAKKEKLNFVKEEVIKLIEPTRKEDGCLQYDLHQDNQDKAIFIFVETWVNQALWQKHMESSHLQSFIEKTDGYLVGLNVHQMTKTQ